jgi:hypothetical protein
MPLENFGEGYSPVKDFFIDETHKWHFLGAIRVVRDIVRLLVCRLGIETNKR